MEKYLIEVHLDSYIAHPYWPEMNELIDIQKKSAMNMRRTDDTRMKALSEYLKKEGISIEHYAELERKSKRQWYRLDNDNLDSEIVIPRHQFSGCLVQAAATAPTGCKVPQDELRSRLQLSDFRTGETKPHDIFKRYVKAEESNQRRYQENEVLKDFFATGSIRFDPEMMKAAAVERLINYSMQFVGLGAARKMGYGRGEVISMKIAEANEPTAAAKTTTVA